MVDLRLLPAALAAWVGVLVGTSGPGAPRVAVPLAGAAAAGALALALWWWRDTRSRPRTPGAHALTPGGSLRLGLALLACAGTCGLVSGAGAQSAHSRDPTVGLVAGGAERLWVTAVLLEDPTPTRSRWETGAHAATVRVTEVTGRPTAGTAMVGAREARPSSARMYATGTGWGHLARGDVVSLSGRVDAGFRADPPFAGTLRADDPELLLRPGGWVGAVREVRAALVRACAGLSDQGRALVPGMAIGDDRRMEETLRQAMLTSSLTHLTAVSGSHVAILLGVVVAVVPGRGWARAAAAVVTMSALVAVVGPEPSVVRSVSTAGVGVCGLLLRRPGQAHAALCAVVVAVLLVDPWSARSFGFALSVLATWGVVGPAATWTRRVRRLAREDTPAGRALTGAVAVGAVPVAAQLMVAPVLLLLNPWLPTWGVVANVLAAPAVAPASLLGIAAACVAPWWPRGAERLAGGAEFFTGWIAAVGGTVAGWPLARLPWPGGSPGIAGLLLLAATGLLGVRVVRRAGGRREVGRRRSILREPPQGYGRAVTGGIAPLRAGRPPRSPDGRRRRALPRGRSRRRRPPRRGRP